MSYLISFLKTSLHGYFEDFTCQLPAGGSAVIVTAHQEENTLLCRILTGITPLTEGVVTIENRPVHEASADELCLLRQKIGIIPGSGGLISNLKMWENIVLPSLYHHGTLSTEQEQYAEEWLEFFGFTKNLMILPATLSLYEKRIAAFVRAAVQSPSVMVYAGCFDGMSETCTTTLIAASHKLMNANPHMTSLFLTSSEETLANFPGTDMYYLNTRDRDRARHT